MRKGIIIQGSSRSNGDTNRLVRFVSEKTQFPIIDLKTKNIAEFDYEFKNRDDDFLPLMRDIVQDYELIIFATPVYWYSMSGIMKTFFDRITDCLKIEKETGRKLRGMEMGVISCANADDLVDGFYMPFVESADYLGMKYLGDVHGWIVEDEMPVEVEEKLIKFLTLFF